MKEFNYFKLKVIKLQLFLTRLNALLRDSFFLRSVKLIIKGVHLIKKHPFSFASNFQFLCICVIHAKIGNRLSLLVLFQLKADSL